MEENGLKVRKIRDGIVIDHIPEGRALKVLRLLGIRPDSGYTIAILMNVESRKIGRKDIVKITGLNVDVDKFDVIALVAPRATVNKIENYMVVLKRKVEPPKRVKGILRCINPTCISRQPREIAEPEFVKISEEPLEYQCIYCGSILSQEDILSQFAS